MNNFLIVLLFCMFISPLNLLSQDYISPVDFEILLSGTFGELRSNHFHAGIDIKTKGVEGHKIKAIYDGYISRIKVSSWGYGKTIYLTHPETGHTSVYAHLQKFSQKINKIVLKKHYQKESFELDFFLEKNAIKIHKGEIIGLSGNSGSSAGAHLHFEIRDTKSQRPINPLKFGFQIQDNLAPILKKLKIYAFDTTLINGHNNYKIYDLNKKGDEYSINEIPEISGPFALGLLTYDRSDGSYNKNGIYNIKILVDSIIHYEFKADQLDFNTTRYINAHIDYFEKHINKEKYHKCYKLENNKLEIYPEMINNGIINLTNNTYMVSILVSDIYNNIANLNFKVKINNQSLPRNFIEANTHTSQLFKYEKANIFKSDNIELHMKPYSLYEDILFMYKKTESIEGTLSDIHSIHESTVPIHKKYIISIKSDIPDSLKNKVCIASTDMKGEFNYLGGIWKKGFLRAKIREFGNFCIIADTTNPEIKALNIFPGKEIKNQKTIQFKIKDNLSGIKSFRGEINGEWILMDYDHKRHLISFDINNNKLKGKQKLSLTVTDNVNNTTTYNSEVIF